MKKIITILLSVIMLIGSFTACESKQEAAVDLDFTQINDAYNTILSFMTNPEDFTGKTMAINATHSVIYNFAQNRIDKQIMLGIDPTGCCNATYEVRSDDGNYPNLGAAARYTGSFNEGGYIQLAEFKADETEEPSYEIDALTMTAAELTGLMESYVTEYAESSNYQKKIRVFGHCVTQDIYHYLMGLDGDGKQTWIIELYDPTNSLSFPIVSGNVVNPIEVIGTLSVYSENNIVYACIEVERITRVECVFS